VFDEVARDSIDAHVASDTRVEKGGVLVGSVDEATGNVTIVAAIPAHRAVSAPASLTFTHEAWDEVNAVLAEEFPSHRMVGWYHSHPLFGIFLSEYDTFIHSNFFNASWQIAYVVDPVLGQSGFFGWEDEKIVRLESWIVLAHGSAKSVREPEKGSSPGSQADSTRTAGLSARGILVVGVILALLLGALSGYILHNSPSPTPQPLSVLPSEEFQLTGTGVSVSLTVTSMTSSQEGDDFWMRADVHNAGSRTLTGEVSNCAPVGAFQEGQALGLIPSTLPQTTVPSTNYSSPPCDLEGGLVAGGTGEFYFDGFSDTDQSPLLDVPTPRFVPVSPVEVPTTTEPPTTVPPTTVPPTTKSTVR
jgi:proteasome lid subunit RPN8/RPN11